MWNSRGTQLSVSSHSVAPRKRRRMAVVVAGAAGIMVAGGVAWAAVPSGGVINACYRDRGGEGRSGDDENNNGGGQLRIIDASAGGSCRRNEKLLTWNQTGPQGVGGSAGATGATGAIGQTGVPGAKGDTGPQGLTGAAGAAGAVGQSGPMGVPGAKGDTGAQGAPGAAGGLGTVTQRDAKFTVAGSEYKEFLATCPDGKMVLSGGPWLFTSVGNGDVPPRLVQSAPVSRGTWEVKIDNLGSPKSWDYTLVLTCLG